MQIAIKITVVVLVIAVWCFYVKSFLIKYNITEIMTVPGKRLVDSKQLFSILT